MAAFEAFEPNVKGTSGLTISVQTSAAGSSISTVLDSTNTYAPHLQVSNLGTSTVWIRMSAEATPSASQADTPVLGNTVRLFVNPVPTGKLGIAVTVSVSTSQFVYFTPGQGGVS